jgi:exosortase/archaeosortase family protein
MKINKKYLFIIYFIVLYIILSFILLKTIAKPLINLWEYLIKSVFLNYFNYSSFIFVPACSGVISTAIYLSIVFSIKYSFRKKVNYKALFKSILLLWSINLLRIVFVLWTEKASFALAKTAHVVSWFIIGIFILFFSIRSFK